MGTSLDPERHMTRRLAPAVVPRSRTDGPSGRLQPVQRTIVAVGGSSPDLDAGHLPVRPCRAATARSRWDWRGW